MAKCGFCKREFSNAQGVRAHLKFCHLYKARGEGPKTLPSQPRRAVSEEEHLNKLLRGASQSQGARFYSSLSASYTKERNLTRFDQPQNSAHPLPRLTPGRIEENRRQVELRKEMERRKQADQRQQEQRKRQLVQQIKSNVVDCYWLCDVPMEARVEAKLAIEKKLFSLQILELPHYEIQQVGEAIRERIYSRYRQNQSVQQVQPTQKENIMAITKLVSGLFICPKCEIEYELDRTHEKDARCSTCHVNLEEVEEEDWDDTDPED